MNLEKVLRFFHLASMDKLLGIVKNDNKIEFTVWYVLTESVHPKCLPSLPLFMPNVQEKSTVTERFSYGVHPKEPILVLAIQRKLAFVNFDEMKWD
jgi:hypothetical protein